MHNYIMCVCVRVSVQTIIYADNDQLGAKSSTEHTKSYC